MNGLALLFVGIYIFTVANNKKIVELGHALKEDAIFINWAVALFLLMSVSKMFPTLKNYDVLIIGAIIIGAEDKSNLSANIKYLTDKITGNQQ